MIQSQLAPSRSGPVATSEGVDVTDDRSSTDSAGSEAEIDLDADAAVEDSDKENIAPVIDRTASVSRDRSGRVTPIIRPARSSASSRRSDGPSSSRTARTTVVQILPTSQASWSPNRRSRSDKSSSARSKRTDQSFRRRLQGYASQTGSQPTSSPELSEQEQEPESEEGVEDPGSLTPALEAVVDDTAESDGIALTAKSGGVVKAEEQASTSVNPHDAILPDQRAPSRRFTRRRLDLEAAESQSGLAQSIRPEAIFVGSDAHSTSEVGSTISLSHEIQEEPLEPYRPIAGPSRRRRSPSTEDAPAEAVPDETASMNPAAGMTEPHAQSASYRNEIVSTAVNGEVTLQFDLDRLRQRSQKRRRRDLPPSFPVKDAYSVLGEGGVTSAAGLSNRDIASAGEALSRVISKADFQAMEVLGQFNKGFIIARLRRRASTAESRRGVDDLYIIDQHASDEKFNFETLQRTTVIKAQSLIRWVRCMQGPTFIRC